MKITWRWYGEDNDSITLADIKQIPNISGIVWSLHNKKAGDSWQSEEIDKVATLIKNYGFNCDVVESVNIHDEIKTGGIERDHYIDIYIDTIEKLSKVGVKVICYNFMPVFDWIRTDLFRELPDGSNALFYEKNKVTRNYQEVIDLILKGGNGYTMPGWEPERLNEIEKLFTKYEDVTDEKLFNNLIYFLQKIGPICKACNIKMAIHPDDPPFSVFGLPRIINSYENINKLLTKIPEEYNGLTLCTGSLGSTSENDLLKIIDDFHKRIYFTHIRNIKRFSNGDFIEVSHYTSDGDVDITNIIKKYYQKDYQYYIRPDHGRHIWGEENFCRPGYGLYDRALGIMYFNGIIDALESE
ncbi:MAG: mannonate dehydratase [Erysipelotrichaceae bacterium]